MSGFSFKLEPLPHFTTSGKLEKALVQAGVVEIADIYIPRNKSFAFLTFLTEQGKNSFLENIGKVELKKAKKALVAEEIEFRPVPAPKKRNLASGGDTQNESKKIKSAVIKQVQDVVTPLWNLDYEAQLTQKSEEFLRLMKRIYRDLVKAYDSSIVFESFPNADHAKKLICTLSKIHASPKKNGYRNKGSFTIGYDVAGKVTIGFRVGGYNSTGFLVGSAALCTYNISGAMIQIAKIVEEFIVSSNIAPYDKKRESENEPEVISGYWRNLLLRTSESTKQVLLMIQVDPNGLKETENEASLQKEFLEHLERNWNLELQMTTVLWQRYSGLSNAAPSDLKYDLLKGEGHIIDMLCGLKFRVQPNSFFQVNAEAAEVLYGIVGDWIPKNLVGKTQLLDVCCGTGTIGLILSRYADKITGLELVADAVEDAKFNAKLNEISNAEFVCGRAEETLPLIVGKNEIQDDQVLAVVDPPREGMHKKALRALRSCENIKQIVYVSCNPKSMASDVLSLMRHETSKRPGKPFRMEKAELVDMFPHTEHCEAVVLLTRCSDELASKMKKQNDKESEEDEEIKASDPIDE
jgi:tRNA (uracil-5-)-methyltransferase